MGRDGIGFNSSCFHSKFPPLSKAGKERLTNTPVQLHAALRRAEQLLEQVQGEVPGEQGKEARTVRAVVDQSWRMYELQFHLDRPTR